jgi:peptidoglycan hydrolase-like protein with peptidoglycan-binding domain
VGGADHNRGLSEERADSVRHFLVDDAQEWMKWYAGKKPNSKRWGTREDQHILRTIKDSSGQPFYSGEVNGQLDTATRQAVKDFQRSRLITETGTPED